MSWKCPMHALLTFSLHRSMGKHPLNGSPPHRLAVIGLCVLLISGCATNKAGGKAKDRWQQDRAILQAQIEDLNKSQAMLGKQFWGMNNQLSELEKRLATHETEQLGRQDRTEAQLAKLSKKLNVSSKETASKGTTSKTIPDHHTRTKNKVPSAVAKSVQPPPKQPPVVSAEEIKRTYINAYLALKIGRYEQANTEFHKFLTKFSDSKYAHRAAYWLGETLHAQGLTTEALAAFQQASDAPGKAPKRNAALLRMGQLYMEIGRTNDAKKAFLLLLREHPQSPEAGTARKLLPETGASSGM